MKPRLALICQRANNVPFVFESAAANGIDFIAVHSPDEAPPAGMPGVVECLPLPVFDDPSRALAEIRQLATRHRIDGILTQREEAVPWTAHAAQALGLPGLDPGAAHDARDKARMRERFRQAGCNVPGFVRLRDGRDLGACASLRYPLVVKPSSGLGSAGVTLVRGDDELAEAVRTITRMNQEKLARLSRELEGEANFAAIVVEEFIDGPEYVAECFSRGGVPHVLSVGYKGDPRGPYFEETVYLAPPPLPEATAQALVAEAARGMRALGLNEGPGHCEMRLGADGQPYILEIGARIGGSGVSHFVVEAATGIDFAGLHFDHALGRSPRPIPRVPEPIQAASNWIIPLGGHGVLSGIDGLDIVSRHPDFQRLLRFAVPGTQFRPYPHFDGFLGFIAAQHRDTNAGLEFFDFLAKTVKVRWAPAAT